MDESIPASKLRTIPVSFLRPGMFIHDLVCSWFSHSLWRRRFLVEDEETVRRIQRDERLREVVIDVSLGLDVSPAMLPSVVPDRLRFQGLDQRFAEVRKCRYDRQKRSQSAEEERARMRLFRRESVFAVRELAEEVRAGRQMNLVRLGPVVDRMLESVRYHPDVLIPLLRLKDHSEYTFQHSVSVAALSMSLGMTLGFDDETLQQMAVGALVHDIGKALTPEEILNKPGPLNAAEMERMREHVVDSQRILLETPGISDLALECAALHHERHDGSGYPHGLVGDDIPVPAQAVSIADVFDAMTSRRCYKAGMEPTEALRRLFGSAGRHFSEAILQAFARTIGIYPVGSLVRLDNEHLAVVIESNRANLLKPKLHVIYDLREQSYINPYDLDLSLRREGPAIVDYESYEERGIDRQRQLVH